MPFQKGHPRFPPRADSVSALARAARKQREDRYTPIEIVPDGLRWYPTKGWYKNLTVLYSIGKIYKLVRTRATGEVRYFKLKDTGPEKSPSEKIDAEPKKARTHLRVGALCWFVVEGRWFLCEIAKHAKHRVYIKSKSGMDAERVTPWPYPEELEIWRESSIFKHIRPLRDRYA